MIDLFNRKVEELMDNQSRRWEEFCRMANNMKSLSADMIQQVRDTGEEEEVRSPPKYYLPFRARLTSPSTEDNCTEGSQPHYVW